MEHLQSSDIRVGGRFFSDEQERLAYGDLIPHEYVHAWDGKFRIPRDLVARDLQQPVAGDLLWVCEGLTRYLNWVLAARSGILSAEEHPALADEPFKEIFAAHATRSIVLYWKAGTGRASRMAPWPSAAKSS